MARQVQIIKGTTAQNKAFTGAEGVLTYDSDKKDIRIHDGTTAGGFEIPSAAMADYVIYWDSGDATDHSHAKPGVATPASGTWYRLYKSGWVEQGGSVGNPNNGCILVTLPISMSNTSCTALASGNTSGDAANYNGVTCERKSSTQIAICTTGQQGNGCSWRVVGYAA